MLRWHIGSGLVCSEGVIVVGNDVLAILAILVLHVVIVFRFRQM